MKTITNFSYGYILILLFLLIFSTFNKVFIEADNNLLAIPSGERAERNWEFVNHNSWGSNYSPQNDINKENVNMLELKWIYPFPLASEFLRYQSGGIPFEGVITPPLIVDGNVFVSSNMRNVYSFDGKFGDLNWLNLYKHDWNKARADLPEIAGGAPHIHGLQYVNGLLYSSTLNCSVQAIDALSGELSFEINKICSNVEGNNYSWQSYNGIGKYGSPSHPGPIFQKENILIVAITGATASWGGGRAFIDAYDLDFDPPKRLWRKFLAPPAEGDPEWALHECDKGWFFSYKQWKEEGKLGIPCIDVPRENIMNDWGVPKHFTSSVSAIWGQMSIDEETGIVYFGTGNQGSWPNQTFVTGPNLYAASTIALDVMTGDMVWWYQQVPRDMVEGDSSWNTVLAKLTIDGEEKKVILKYSVTGLLWALDAATGEPLWIFESPLLESRTDPDGAIRGRTSGHPCIGCDPNTQDGYWNNVMSYYDMHEKKWLNYPSKDWFYWIPARAGEADIAVDMDKQTIFLPVAGGVDKAIKAGQYGSLGDKPGEDYYLDTQPKNVTLYAVDAITGKVKWSYFIDGVAYRGGVMSSGGVVYLPAADGNLYMFDADNGQLLDNIFLSNSLLVLPTIGKTIDGEPRLFVISGGRGAYAIGGITKQNIPGAIFSFGLPDNYSEKRNESASSGVDSLCEAGVRGDCVEIPAPAAPVPVEPEPEKQEQEEKKAESRILESDSVDNYWFDEQFYNVLLGSVVIIIIGISIIKIIKLTNKI